MNSMLSTNGPWQYWPSRLPLHVTCNLFQAERILHLISPHVRRQTHAGGTPFFFVRLPALRDGARSLSAHGTSVAPDGSVEIGEAVVVTDPQDGHVAAILGVMARGFWFSSNLL